MEDEQLSAYASESPFPHLIIDNFYNPEELELIWEELNFYTKPGKLLEAKDYGGVVGYTNAKALMLDSVYKDYSNNDGNSGAAIWWWWWDHPFGIQGHGGKPLNPKTDCDRHHHQ